MTTQRFIAHGLIEVDGRFLFLKRRQGGYLGGQWDIPGGAVEPGEASDAAAARECLEEAGLACVVGERLSHVENMDTGGRDINFHTVTFRLYPEETDLVVTISHEHEAFVWATVEETASLDLVRHVKHTLEDLG